MYEFEKTDEFKEWLKSLNKNIRSDITQRIDHATAERLGKTLKGTGGLSEIVMDTGPGYRLYYCRETNTKYWLLFGGIKKNQPYDIKQAQDIHKDLKRSDYGKTD